MKQLKKFKKEHFWLICIILGPLIAYYSVFSPSLIILALIFLVLGLKGVLCDIM